MNLLRLAFFTGEKSSSLFPLKSPTSGINEKASKILSQSAKSNIYESLNRMEEKVNNSKRKIDALRELEKDDMNSRFEKYDDKPSDVDLEALKSEVFGSESKDGKLDE